MVHPSDLRNGGVGFIDDRQETFGKVVEEGIGRFSGLTQA
jgi:hypothetical protein